MGTLYDSGGFGWRQVLRVSASAGPTRAPRLPSVSLPFDVFGQAVTTIVTSTAKSRSLSAEGEKFPHARLSARLPEGVALSGPILACAVHRHRADSGGVARLR